MTPHSRTLRLVAALFALGLSSALAFEQTSFFGVPVNGPSSAVEEPSSNLPEPSTPEDPNAPPPQETPAAPMGRSPGTLPANAFYKMVSTNGCTYVGTRGGRCLCKFESLSPTVDVNGTLVLVVRTLDDAYAGTPGKVVIRFRAKGPEIASVQGMRRTKTVRIPLSMRPARSVEIEIENQHPDGLKLNSFSKGVPEVYLEIKGKGQLDAGGVVVDWQKKTVEEFPSLMDPNSELNHKFIERIRVLKASNPGYFNNPQWPYLLAKEVSAGTTSASQIPGMNAALGGGSPAKPGAGGTGKVTVQQATKERPFVNSLGMKFVPVPGTNVLFSVWETREQDFAPLSRATGVKPAPKNPKDYTQCSPTGPTMPVTMVGKAECDAFCRWLSQKESLTYRLPSDDEWSAAAGNTIFPWGDNQPPPSVNANIAGEEAKTGQWPKNRPVTVGHQDRFPRASPVGSFPPNALGIFDLGGNVWERTTGRKDGIRGGSWVDTPVSTAGQLISSPINGHIGFRCVVEVPPGQ